MDLKIALKKIILKWRIMLIILIPAMMFFTLVIIASPSPVVANKGKADLSGMDFSQGKVVSLKGQWEFYWGKLLMPDNFKSDSIPQMDSFIKVPGIWSDYDGTNYTRQGIATYRLLLYYPPTLKDPSLRIQNVGNAYKLYVNGELMSKVGNVIDDKANMKNDDKIVIINLPKDTQKIELVFQVSNYNCVSGGLRATPVLGSRQVLEQQRMTMLLLQICFIGGALIFCFYYFFLFLLQRKNKTALLFAIFCFFTVLRSMLMGEIPLQIMFPNVPPELRMNINYLTGYNYVAIVILFVHSIYASEFNKKVMSLFLLPSLGFDAVLLFNGPVVMTFYTNYIYILMLLQILYLMCVMIKAVLRKKDNAVLMFITICGLIGAICVDIINFILIGSVYLTCMFLLGNFSLFWRCPLFKQNSRPMTTKNLFYTIKNYLRQTN